MRRLLRLIAIMIVLFAGYWAYFVFAAGNPNDPLGVEINKYLPTSAREFACKKLKERFADAKAPEGCAEFAFWAPAPVVVEPPAAEPAPAVEPAPAAAPAAEAPATPAPAVEPAPVTETPAAPAPAAETPAPAAEPAPAAPAAEAPATDTPATAAP
ncbi:hypothetical protein K32_26500 [Kaistia sp. 32K]|uniref:hypothetical protein n=1 Tax=Kaistia sp. 32K TaxID=2795690 RepID=UPI0019162E55|nr:hypothetical protein [Kaistia sp. 32K]BCP54033.1 hypothetical protein K32_26500 [Kaistia sp. 32K]